MGVKEQKILFTVPVVWMFLGFIGSVLTCPPWQEGEGWQVFTLEVFACLLPAFVLLFAARKLSEAK